MELSKHYPVAYEDVYGRLPNKIVVDLIRDNLLEYVIDCIILQCNERHPLEVITLDTEFPISIPTPVIYTLDKDGNITSIDLGSKTYD